MRAEQLNSLLSKTHYYASTQALVDDVGREFEIGSAPRLRGRAVKQCFRNAFEVSKKYNLGYAEGYILIGSLPPVDHAWNVTKNGECIDVTSGTYQKRYFGIEFPLKFVSDVRKCRRGFYGVIDDFQNDFPMFQQKFDLEKVWQIYRDLIRSRS